jgi:hypothetical protein
VAKLASVRGKTTRGDTTEKLLGLNRQALRTHHSGRIKQPWFSAQKAMTDPKARQLLDDAATAAHEYSAFAHLPGEALLDGNLLGSTPLKS